MKMKDRISPWAWVPTLYFAEGIPYFMVNVISVIMFKRMGMGNADVAMYTGLLYLPWVVKPLWSPFVDIIRTKRWWVIGTQTVMSMAFAAIAFSLPFPPDGMTEAGAVPVPMFAVTLAIFWITAFASATHDIAADGFYMLALDTGSQSVFVGIRSTFYRLSSIFGQGVLVVVAGILETKSGNIPLAWSLTVGASAVLFGIMTIYHSFVLPRPAIDSRNGAVSSEKTGCFQNQESALRTVVKESGAQAVVKESGLQTVVKGSVPQEVAKGSGLRAVIKEFGHTFSTFFRKKGIVPAMLFMLLYRLPEAFLVKMLNPFLLDSADKGGLGLATETVGIVYGTIGVAALTIGGILGGFASARWGLKKVLWPMALSLALPCLSFVYLAAFQPDNIITINICVALDQFGYGFGFTAYMLYMMYFSDGEYRTSHYSLCTAFMALSMMIPGMAAGYLQEWLGYRDFFWMVIVCCAATIGVTFCVKIDREYGKKN